MASNSRMALMMKLPLEDQILLVDDLISEDTLATIKDFIDALQEIENIK